MENCLDTGLFTDRTLLNQLSSHVKCETNSDQIQATGIPPFVSILRDVKSLKIHMDKLEANQRTISRDVIDGVVQVLEDRAIGAGTVTRDGLRDLLRSVLRDEGIIEAGRRINNPSQSSTVETDNETTQQLMTPRIYSWNGRLSRLPQSFTLPRGTCITAWQAWCCGNVSQGYPPLRLIEPSDICDRKAKSRLGDLRFLMRVLEEEADSQGESIENITIEDCNRIYEVIKDVIQLPNRTRNNRQRRNAQLSWQTVATELRKVHTVE